MMSAEHKYVHIIDGEPSGSEATNAIVNPATGAHLADAPVASREQLDRAVDSARKAFPAWSSKSYEERADVLLEMAKIIEAEVDVYKKLLTAEQGKPVRTMGSTFSFNILTLGLASRCSH
jgi:acyl-CoA reductase-like NAD-dependent aldehyde dehydrogenase